MTKTKSGKTKVPNLTLLDRFGGGTSLIGYMTASYKDLHRVLGPPNVEAGDKVSTEWAVKYKGYAFTIYDYKETNIYDRSLPSVRKFRSLPSYEWHIGGHGTLGLEEFKRAILEAIENTGEVLH